MAQKKGKSKNRAPSQKSVAAAVVEQDEATYSEVLIAEVASAAEPKLKHPPILQFHQLDRRRRALLTERVTALLPLVEEFSIDLEAADGAAPAIVEDTATATKIMQLLADVEDVLATVAVDQAAFRAWALQQADDAALLTVFSKFCRSFRLGEAKRSST